jgi:hypothetical protein
MPKHGFIWSPLPQDSTTKLHFTSLNFQTMASLPVYIPDWLETELRTGEPLSVICE